MEERKKNIRRVFWLYFVLFIALQIYLMKLIFFDSKDIRVNPNNARLNMFDNKIKRGKIIDAKGEILAESLKSEEGYKRIYYLPEAFAHVIGNVAYQKTGIEAKYNFILTNLALDVWQRLKNVAFDSDLEGDNIVLTVDSEFQKFLYEKMKNLKGAIVCIEPKTGKMLAMVSSPSYDSNQIKENWDELINDEDKSPLLNRASKGLYPPGSTFKIITALTIIRNCPDYRDYVYNCKGSETIDNVKIQCYDGHAHGDVNLESAIAHSCNCYFYHMIQNKFTPAQLHETAESLYFNEYYDYPLEYSKSSFVLDENSDTAERGQTAIGQGKTLMTPIHIAMITSAIANGGIMMEPYFLDHAVGAYLGEHNKTAPKKIAEVMTSEEAGILTEMMKGVIESGTGRDAKISGISMAGKTGTAQNATGNDHGLFTVFAPADDPKIAVTIIVEEGATTGKALSIARQAIEYYLN